LEIVRRSERTVAENLLVDEIMARQAGRTGGRALRLWWGGEPTAVLGCGDKPETALDLAACANLGVPYVRRVTGGGAVLQTPGVLNYSYTAPDPGSLDIRAAFGQVTEIVVEALRMLGVTAHKRGISDVAVGDLKISGNAQARKWKSVLVHGTLLVNTDIDLMDAVLRHPCKEPDYRRGRRHRDFVVTLAELGVQATDAEVENALTTAAAYAL
jgi:lipoate-protein ligase A